MQVEIPIILHIQNMKWQIKSKQSLFVKNAMSSPERHISHDHSESDNIYEKFGIADEPSWWQVSLSKTVFKLGNPLRTGDW